MSILTTQRTPLSLLRLNAYPKVVITDELRLRLVVEALERFLQQVRVCILERHAVIIFQLFAKFQDRNKLKRRKKVLVR
jgi:hypothetical protein